MSYQSILISLQTTIVDGPCLANAMRKPGATNGVWLFGARHVPDTGTIAADSRFANDGAGYRVSPVRDVLSAVTSNTFLMIESYTAPGEAPFAGLQMISSPLC